MAKRSSEYSNESIKMLKGADRVRKRPGVIFGSDGIEGCEHAVFEILTNSIDEARQGYGNKIIVTYFADNSVQVEDFARGIPVDYNASEKKYNWELLFCELYAGAKFDNSDSAFYEYSLGLNGLGLCATQYASEYMEADIRRDGFRYVLNFKHGKIAKPMEKTPYEKKDTGSRIRWRPDLKVFQDINIPRDYFVNMIKRQSVINAGITFILKIETENGFEEIEYRYENGIEDYVKEITGEDTLTPVVMWETQRRGRDREDKPEYNVKLSVSLCFSNKLQLLEYYHNSSYLEHGGSPDKAVKNAFLYQIDSFLKQKNLYKKGESKISFIDVQDCLVLVSSSFSNVTSYENQTKKAINNRFIAVAMTEFLREKLEIYFIENPDEAQKIAQQVLINKRSRENAEKTRLDLKKTMSASVDMVNRVQKFVDCRTRDVGRREIYIVEGDSALGACKQARDAEFQAIIPVRGKILNCLKAEYNKIFKSEIISDIIKVLGCGVDVSSKFNKELSTFDISNLRWNKVVICTDADVDGFQIRTLILTMLYRLTPKLIEDGYVYIAESPLYEITEKERVYFAYSDAEKTRITEELDSSGKKYTLQRSKGLGENEPDMMWMTTMNPDSRRLIKVSLEDADKTMEMFDLLLGDNLAGRKDYIRNHGIEYLDELDVS